MADRFSIEVYGPRGLEVASHPLISLVRFAPPTDEPQQGLPPEPEKPYKPPFEVGPPGEDNSETVGEAEPGPVGHVEPEIVSFADVAELLQADALAVGREAMHVPPLGDRSIVVVLEVAPDLPREAFDVVRDIGTESRVEVVPLYVQRLR
jgi:hypothetical protein